MAKGSVRKKGKKWYYRFYVEDASGNLVQKEFAGTENKSETEKLRRNGVLAAQKTMESSKVIWSTLFRGYMRKAKYWKQITMQFLIQDYLIAIISRSMFILSQILSRTGRDGSWRDFIRNTIFSKLEL